MTKDHAEEFKQAGEFIKEAFNPLCELIQNTSMGEKDRSVLSEALLRTNGKITHKYLDIISSKG